MAEKTRNAEEISLSEEESLKEKIELEEILKKKCEELDNKPSFRIYAHDSSEEDKKREVNQKMINTIKNLYGF